MEYDVIIIGSGMAGLVAAKKARQKKLNFCVLAEDFGATQFFSGCFDVIDPCWQNKTLHPRQYPSLQEALSHFVQAHPEHLYARLKKNTPYFYESFFSELKDFFSFYALPVAGDGNTMVTAFGPTGKPKPTAYTLLSQGLSQKEIQGFDSALHIDFPFLTSYPKEEIQKNLNTVFPRVETVSYTEFQPDPLAPMASYLKYFDQPEHCARLFSFIQTKYQEGTVVFLPPVLGLHTHFEWYKHQQKNSKVRVIELLPVLPSAPGVRFVQHMSTQLISHGMTHEKGTVLFKNLSYQNPKFTDLELMTKTGVIKQFKAHVCVLATGSFSDKPVFPQTVLSSFPSRQTRVRVCGHALSGFDYTREHCGFGVSLSSVLSCFE